VNDPLCPVPTAQRVAEVKDFKLKKSSKDERRGERISDFGFSSQHYSSGG
jgi:hypothetical protein